MKLGIREFCIRCMLCQSLYPELIEIDLENDVMRIKADLVPDHLIEAAKSAIRDCAVTAIFIHK